MIDFEYCVASRRNAAVDCQVQEVRKTIARVMAQLMHLFRHIGPHFDEAHQSQCVINLSKLFLLLRILCRILKAVSDPGALSKMPVDKFTDLFVKA